MKEGSVEDKFSLSMAFNS